MSNSKREKQLLAIFYTIFLIQRIHFCISEFLKALLAVSYTTYHRDGDTLNCRRGNLRWATHSLNARNVRGSHSHDLIEDHR